MNLQPIYALTVSEACSAATEITWTTAEPEVLFC